MAETRYSDCPRCNRSNVVGYKIETNGEKILKVGGAGYGLVMGALLGGPIGAAIGFTAGKYGGDKLADGVENGDADFQFQCPSCGHRFTINFKK